MIKSLQFKYRVSCHCGAHFDGMAGKHATEDVPKNFREFFDTHKECQPKKKSKDSQSHGTKVTKKKKGV